ncbi:cytochrome b [Duganella sp. Dugasp56]|uniref:cytochrome b n=1 Tax=Duganella sp. Dugasp56 TaxID=3243046 RepID=UPI0039AF0EF7
MILKNTRERFGTVAKTFHWSMAIAFIAAYVIVYYVIWFIDPETSIKPPLFGMQTDDTLVIPLLNLHWVLGVAVGVLVVPRLLWRIWSPAPDPVPGSRMEHQMARLAHWGLYLLMIMMPVTGYMNTNDPTNFGVFVVPAFKDTSLYHWIAAEFALSWKDVETPMEAVHRFLGHWVAWVVVALHASAALFHHFARRDDTLTRMLPGAGTPPKLD